MTTQQSNGAGHGAEVLLEARGVSAGYGALAAIRNLDLQIRAGEVVALLGANGAGKTTTILTLAGELPPLAGEVRWLGAPASAPLFRRARAGLGLVTEERAVFTTLSVRENLSLGEGGVDRAVALFPEIAGHLDRRAGLLSGGQQQMLTLARTLAARPKVLLADELSLGLAPLIVQRLLAAVQQAARDGVGVLLVEQHVRQALSIADRVCVLQRGRIVFEGSADRAAAEIDQIEKAYLEGVTELRLRRRNPGRPASEVIPTAHSAPACWQGGRAEVDAVDAEAVQLLERGELPGDAFDEVREALGLGVVVGDGENVDLDRHGGVGWQLVLAVGA